MHRHGGVLTEGGGCFMCDAGDYGADDIITPVAYLRHARTWAAAGADIIGGCCAVGPEHMQLLAELKK